MPWLRRVAVDRSGVDVATWPWWLSAVAAVDDLVFTSGVTFLAGENGTGKSTVLELVRDVRSFLDSPERLFRYLLD